MRQETINLSEARRLMPSTTASMSDEELVKLINNLELLASAFIEAVQFDKEFRVNIEYNRGGEWDFWF